ncbi:hypothetical protein WMY93_028412 [Mugilogobius chulae]|uniref:Uncharacterized protein n=1 Tax=Mugilogobius chulae TaxID=88201 RepID=A0AAW0MUZ8_9GOBI
MWSWTFCCCYELPWQQSPSRSKFRRRGDVTQGSKLGDITKLTWEASVIPPAHNSSGFTERSCVFEQLPRFSDFQVFSDDDKMKFFRDNNAELVRELRGQLESAGEIIRALQSEAETDKETKDQKERQLQRLENNVVNLQQDKATLQQNIRAITVSAKAKIDIQEQDIRSLYDKLRQEREKSQGLQEQVCRLQHEKTEEKEKNRKLEEQSQAEKEAMRVDLQAKQEEVQSLRQRTEEKQLQHQQELDLKEEKIRQMRRNLQETSREHLQNIRTMSDEYREAMDEAIILARRLKESKKEVCDLKEENQTLKETCQKSAEEEMERMRQIMEKQRDEFQQELKQKEEEKKELQGNLSAALKEVQEKHQEHLQDIKNMTEEYRKVKNLVIKLAAGLKVSEQNVRDLKEKHEKEIQSLKETCQKSAEEEMARMKRIMEKQRDEFQQELKQKEEEKKELQGNLSAALKEVQEKHQDIQTMTEENKRP